MEWSQVEQSPQYQKLNPQQREQLKQRYITNVGVITPTAQVPVAVPPAPTTTPAQPVQPATEELMGGLAGRIPMPEEEYQRLQNLVMGRAEKKELVPHLRSRFYEEAKRRKSYETLLSQGYDPQQITTAVEVGRQLQRFPWGRSIGATVAGIGIPALINLIPGMQVAPEEAVTVPLGIKAAQFISGVASAGFGGATGEAAQTALEEGRLATRKELINAALTEMATEAGFRGLAIGGKALFSPLVKQTIPEAAQVIEDFAKVGGVLTPAQMDKRLLVKAGEEVARGGFGAREIFEDVSERNVTAARLYANNILDSLAEGASRKSSIEMGEDFAAGITSPSGRIYRMVDELFEPLYKRVDQLTKGTKVSTSPLKTLAKKELAIDSRMVSEGKGIYLTPKGRAALGRVLNLKDNVSFSDMRTIRSVLIAESRTLGRDLDRSEALVRRLAEAANESVFEPKNWKTGFVEAGGELGYKGLTPEATRLLENTNRLYKSTMDAFENTFAQKLITKLQAKPSTVMKEVFRPKNPLAVRQLRQALIEPISGRPSTEGKIMWNQLRTAWLSDVVDEATKEGKINYHTFDAALRNIGDDTLKEMFPGTDIKQLNSLKDVFRVTTATPIAGASLFIRGAQVGGAVMMYKGIRDDDFLQISAGGTLLMGPYFYAKLATNPTGRKLLTAGFKKGFRPGTSTFAPSVARVINLARQLDREEVRTRARGAMARQIEETEKPPFPEYPAGLP